MRGVAEDGTPQRPPLQRPTVAITAWNDQAPVGWKTPGAIVAGILAVLAGVIPAVPSRFVLLALGVGVVAIPLLFIPLTRRRIWLWIASQLGFGSRFRWFAKSSFFSGDNGFEERLRRVFDRLVSDDKSKFRLQSEFRLQMKAFAFLEDLRDNYRKLSPSLRGFKRSAPPVVFLRGITAGNGGVELLSAMSDIRSVRSEIYPLLVVACVDFEHHRDLGGLPEVKPPSSGSGSHRSFLDLYEHWTMSLRTAQVPSGDEPLPWLLRIPIPDEDPDEDLDDEPALAFRLRPRWTWLWSWRALVATVLVLAIVAVYAQTRLRDMYCQVGFPLSWNADTRLRTDADHSRECIGVATNGVRFERGSDSVSLDGDLRKPDSDHRNGQLTQADLLSKIEDENADVVSNGKPYVTVLYAGILTAASGKEELAVAAAKELAGAYLAQMRNNGVGQPGEVGNPLKIRLLAVNVGQDMAFSDDAVDRVLAIARRDQTVIGVVGMARNTQNSQRAIRRLSDAGLPVISTVNSSDVLPTVSHFYGMAATDHDEAAALKPAIQRELGERSVDRALIVQRESGPSLDTYSGEIASDAKAALHPRHTTGVTYVGTDDIATRVKTACENAGSRPYTLVYFAGRAEDLPGLMNGLSGGGCTRHKLILLAGDEVATVRFGTQPHEVPLNESITLYFTAFAYLPNLIADHKDQQNAFFLLARNLLGIGTPSVAPNEPLFVDAQMALSFDATTALAEASQNAFSALDLNQPDPMQVPGSGSVTSGSVLLELRRLLVRQAATGDIDFRDDRHTKNGSGNRGLTLVRVSLESGQPSPKAICGRLGGTLSLRVPPCLR